MHVQVWAATAAQQGVAEVAPEAKWAAGLQLVEALGDSEAAARHDASCGCIPLCSPLSAHF